jgi:choline dehydrogenase-like flavoprotein
MQLPRVRSARNFGGIRMRGPADAVIDRFGATHEAEHLVVRGGATFPTADRVHPTLIIQPLAWRAAKQVARDAGVRVEAGGVAG